MAVAKVIRNLKHDGVRYKIGETIEAAEDVLKALEKSAVVEKVRNVIEGEVVEDKAADEPQESSDDKAAEVAQTEASAAEAQEAPTSTKSSKSAKS